jgi:hypothetical protein
MHPVFACCVSTFLSSSIWCAPTIHLQECIFYLQPCEGGSYTPVMHPPASFSRRWGERNLKRCLI